MREADRNGLLSFVNDFILSGIERNKYVLKNVTAYLNHTVISIKFSPHYLATRKLTLLTQFAQKTASWQILLYFSHEKV